MRDVIQKFRSDQQYYLDHFEAMNNLLVSSQFRPLDNQLTVDQISDKNTGSAQQDNNNAFSSVKAQSKQAFEIIDILYNIDIQRKKGNYYYYPNVSQEAFLECLFKIIQLNPMIVGQAILQSQLLKTTIKEEDMLIQVLNKLVDKLKQCPPCFEEQELSQIFYLKAIMYFKLNQHRLSHDSLLQAIKYNKKSMKCHEKLLHLCILYSQFSYCISHIWRYIDRHQSFGMRTLLEIKKKIDEEPQKLKEYFCFNYCFGLSKYYSMQYQQAYGYFIKQTSFGQSELFGLIKCISDIDFKLKRWQNAFTIAQYTHYYGFTKKSKDKIKRQFIMAICQINMENAGPEYFLKSIRKRIGQKCKKFSKWIFYLILLYKTGKFQEAVSIIDRLKDCYRSKMEQLQGNILLIACHEKMQKSEKISGFLCSVEALFDDWNYDLQVPEYQKAFSILLFLINYYYEHNKYASGRNFCLQFRKLIQKIARTFQMQDTSHLLRKLEERKQIDIEDIL